MAIRLAYTCKDCSALRHSQQMDEAQKHANETDHEIMVSGVLTSTKPKISPGAIAESAAQKLRDGAVMRAARDRGLLK